MKPIILIEVYEGEAQILEKPKNADCQLREDSKQKKEPVYTNSERKKAERQNEKFDTLIESIPEIIAALKKAESYLPEIKEILKRIK